jgi:flavodoxin
MKIAMVIYSRTGHTMSVAEKMESVLKFTEHEVDVHQIIDSHLKIESRESNVKNLEDYDVVIFGSPVHAFTLSVPMKRYLKNMPQFTNKKAGCFVTQDAENAFWGGNRSIRQMKKACLKKGANVYATGIVHWTANERDQQINDLIKDFIKV